MVVRSVRHRGLRRLIEEDNPGFLRHDLVDRVRKILTTLILAEELSNFMAVHLVAGESTGSQATGRMNGAFRYPVIGGSLLKKRAATSTT